MASKSKEYGEDYWIDEQDLQQAQLRAQAVKNRMVRHAYKLCYFLDIPLRQLILSVSLAIGPGG